MPTAAALPADTARLTPTPVCTAQLRNDDTKLPDWLAIAMRPAGGYGATICAQRCAGVDTTPCPFGSGEQHAELAGERDELLFGPPAFVARFAVARAGEERGADPALGRGAEQLAVRRRGRAHEHEVPRAVGQLVDAAHGVDAEHRHRFEVGRTDRSR